MLKILFFRDIMGYESEIDSDAPPPIQGTSHSSERLSADPDLR